jgi:hypothetical protein
LLGKTLKEIVGDVNSETLEFVADDGKSYRMYHSQDCCETVTINDICGDLKDLIGVPIIQAEESESTERPEGVEPPSAYADDSETWTFYRLATAKGQVVIRWYGSSNGYYSESVEFCELYDPVRAAQPDPPEGK